jgi:hypothetical protein
MSVAVSNEGSGVAARLLKAMQEKKEGSTGTSKASKDER